MHPLPEVPNSPVLFQPAKKLLAGPIGIGPAQDGVSERRILTPFRVLPKAKNAALSFYRLSDALGRVTLRVLHLSGVSRAMCLHETRTRGGGA